MAMHDDYLEWVEKYRKDGFSIFYEDETWVFKNMTSSKIWREPGNTEIEKVFAVPSGKGNAPSYVMLVQKMLIYSKFVCYFED